MEYQYNDIPDTPMTVMPNEEVPGKNNNMALASMIMGIIGLVLGCCCMGTIFGGLAVLFACLSRTGTAFEPKAKAGLIMGIIAIILTIVMFFVFMSNGLESFYSSYSSIASLRYWA